MSDFTGIFVGVLREPLLPRAPYTAHLHANRIKYFPVASSSRSFVFITIWENVSRERGDALFLKQPSFPHHAGYRASRSPGFLSTRRRPRARSRPDEK